MHILTIQNDNFNQIINSINQQRSKKDFYSIMELLELSKNENTILDPFSTLISRKVKMDNNNTFYPNTIVEINNNGHISIGSNNIFYPNTFLLADTATISIGNDNIFGDGGLSIKANTKTSKIIIGNCGRYMNGAQIIGNSYLGNGSQILGNITAQNCYLEDGESYTHSNVNLRGAVLKGNGLARNIKLSKGTVINAQGLFKQCNQEDQAVYHLK